MVFILSIIGGLIDRLRGWGPTDYMSPGTTAYKRAQIAEYATSRGLMAALTACLYAGYAYFEKGADSRYAVAVLLVTFVSYTVLGGLSRRRIYTAYNGAKAVTPGYTSVVGNLIPGDNKVVNHLRGFLEATMYGGVMLSPLFATMLVFGHLDSIVNWGVASLAFGIGRTVPLFAPQIGRAPYVDFSLKRITMKQTTVRNELAEILSMTFVTYWVLLTL